MNELAEHMLFREIQKVRERVEQNPINSDIVPAYNAMQVADFAAQTHIEIEKGLKWAIRKAGGNPRRTHCLQALLQDLKDAQIILNYLRESFIAARKFYRIDVSRPDFKHLKTFDSYLNKIGGKKVYHEARYATLNAVSEEDFSLGSFSPGSLRYIFPQAHIEIMRALERLKTYDSWQGNSSHKDNVISRVEREVCRQILASVNYYSTTVSPEIHEVYREWRKGAASCVDALEVAVRNNLEEEDSCGEMRKVLLDAYEKLSMCKDPAVKYRMDTFRYIEKASQSPLEGIDLEQCLRQVNKSKDLFEVCSPSGEHIGFLQRCFDGSWSSDALAEVPFVAWERDDAAWLILRLGVWHCDFVINGVARRHLLIGHECRANGFRISRGTEPDEDVANQDCELKFWDNGHGLKVGDRIAVSVVESTEWQEAMGRNRKYLTGNIILGDVSEVNGHEVSLVADEPILTTLPLELPLEEFLSKYVAPDFFNQ